MSEWISVKDRLPDDCQKVLIYTQANKIAHEMYVHFYDSRANSPIWNIVTHWMPLPPPPKQE
jgi:hypothetical protein